MLPNLCSDYYLEWMHLRLFTSRDNLWTSVTSHHAHAQPPTRVFFCREPQQPPEMLNMLTWAMQFQRTAKSVCWANGISRLLSTLVQLAYAIFIAKRKLEGKQSWGKSAMSGRDHQNVNVTWVCNHMCIIWGRYLIRIGLSIPTIFHYWVNCDS